MQKLFIYHTGQLMGGYKFKEKCSTLKKELNPVIGYNWGWGIFFDDSNQTIIPYPPINTRMIKAGTSTRIITDWEMLIPLFTQNNIVPTWKEGGGNPGLYEDGKWKGLIGQV